MRFSTNTTGANYNFQPKSVVDPNHLGNVLTVVSDRKLQNPGNTMDLLNDYEQPFNAQSTLPASNSGGGTYCAKLNNGFSPGMYTEVHVGDIATAGIEYFKAATSTGLLVLSVTDEYGNFLYDNDPNDAASGVLWLPSQVTVNNSWQSLSINKTIFPVFSDAAKTIAYTGRIFINSHAWNPNANDCWFDNHTLHIAQAVPMVSNYKAEILETHDYYAGGMVLPGRSFNAGDYRYGMNGQEKDDEIFQGAMSAEYWEYDSRIIRRWNMDPIEKPWESPYACFNGNPIYFSDPTGLSGVGPNGKAPGDEPAPKKEGGGDNTYSQRTNPIEDNGRFFKRGEEKHNATPKVQISIGNAFASKGGPMIYSNQKSFYQTDIHRPLSLHFKGPNSNDLTEGNHTFDAKFRFQNTHWQTGVSLDKEKFYDDGNEFGYEAPGGFRFMNYLDLPLFDNLKTNWQSFSVNVNLGVGAGFAIGAPRLNGVMYAGGLAGYRVIGSSSSAIVRVDAHFLSRLVFSVMVTGNNMRIRGFSEAPEGSQGEQSYSSLGFKAAVGFVIGKK